VYIILEMTGKSKVPSLVHIKPKTVGLQTQSTDDCQVEAKFMDYEMLCMHANWMAGVHCY
jgi:hypothetical protein